MATLCNLSFIWYNKNMNIAEQIFKAFSEGKTLVFPSETAARSQLAAYLKTVPGKAVLTDKALSFDTYKQNCTDFTKNKEKAQNQHRLLFAAGLFKSDKIKQLEYFTCETFATEVALALPMFKDLLKQDLNSKLKNDINLIYTEYQAFLDKCGLYEESYFEPNYKDDNTVFVFPQTYRDDSAENLKGEKISAVDNELPNIKFFANSIAEIRDTIRSIYDLLQKGVKPSDIAITVTDMNSYKAQLESEAFKRGIKLAFMQGQNLSNYPSGRLFGAIKNVYDQEYSCSSIKSLLLDPVYPFKDKEKISNLIRNIILCNVADGKKDGSVIKDKLIKLPEVSAPESLDFFISLSDFIKGLCTAKAADEFRKAIKGFQDKFFVEKAWDLSEDINRKVFQRCMDQIDKLEDAMHISQIKTDNFLELFITVLNNTTYMDQDVVGIKVYSYPLSCGIASDYHFVLGLDDVSSRVPLKKLPFTSKLSEKNAIQIGDSLQRAYCYNTTGLTISCAQESFTNTCVVPSLFSENKKIEEVKTVKTDSFIQEELLWMNNSKNGKATKVQKEAFDRALETSFSAGNKIAIPQAIGPYKISATSLETFAKCPYRWMCQYLLEAKDEDFEPNQNDARELGAILHETYGEWFAQIKTVEQAKTEGSQKLLDSIFEKKLLAFSNTFKAPSKLYLERLRQFYTGRLGRIVKNDKGLIEGCTFSDKEKQFSIQCEDYYLDGSIDCIFTTEEGNFVVLDFKTGKAPKSHQVAFYAKALETTVKGAFYSINESKYTVVFDDDLSLEKAIDECNKQIVYQVENLNKNNYEASPSKDNCQYCNFSRICRKRYVVK